MKLLNLAVQRQSTGGMRACGLFRRELRPVIADLCGTDNGVSGEPAGIRTQDPMIKSHVLYQLSYGLYDL